MILSPLYQAIEKRDSQSVCSPILSTQNTWLGEGYYFWDGFVELPHWWGVVHYDNNYIINEASVEVNSSEYLDLVGDTSAMRKFISAYKVLQQEFPEENITVKAVIALMKQSGIYSFRVVRARTEHKIPGSEKIRFVIPDKAYMVSIPAIQICVTDNDLIKSYNTVFRSGQ